MSLATRSRGALLRLRSLGTPAATVSVLRDGNEGVELLLLRKASRRRFGGFWVFPGGAEDARDHAFNPDDGSLDVLATASKTAAREAS